MQLESILKVNISKAISAIFGQNISEEQILLQATKKEFEGSYTFVTFALAKELKQGPPVIATKIGEFLVQNCNAIQSFNVVQGFLNLAITQIAWQDTLAYLSLKGKNLGQLPANGQKVMVEYSSPNTNKPLHLGHLRNNFLGYSVAQILKANGFDVIKSSVVNNRGVHICKSMIAYQLFGQNETPESLGLKGDHLVGKYYVEFDKAYKLEIETLVKAGIEEDLAKKEAPLMKKAQQMLLDWENGDEKVLALWHKMNEWVYAGFNATYKTMGVDFDITYYESDTYLDGKKRVEEGLANGVFYKKENGSVWADLTEVGLDEKLVLRADGTSVYITQDLGLADRKYDEFKIDKSVYVVGNEQDYHFEVLFKLMQKLGREYSNGLYHLSYGMVDLPSGKMKSREGTVVDADELMAEMVQTAQNKTTELGKTEGMEPQEAQQLYQTLAMGALKYFLLKVDPKKRMMFNPEESIEFQGNTGPFIQYTYARIEAILRKAHKLELVITAISDTTIFEPIEIELIALLNDYTNKVIEAGTNYAPSIIANYIYDLAKTFNSFYAEISVLAETNEVKKNMRLVLCKLISETICHGMGLLGIGVPNRM